MSDTFTKEPNNYWNTCGIDAEFLPDAPCTDSTPEVDESGRVTKEPKNPWWINSKDHHYCFWKYVHEKSQPNGTMEPLLQAEIAQLFGCSSTKIHFMLKEALAKLRESPTIENFKNLAHEDVEHQFSTPNSSEMYADVVKGSTGSSND